MQQEVDLDQFRANTMEFTRAAFHFLPPMKLPAILDIGCGSGVQTLELAHLSDGKITGIDTDTKALEKLRTKSQQAGLGNRITIIQMSMLEMEFQNKAFDIIWAEGSIFVAGFERGLREWKQYLKEGGFLVIHDNKRDLKNKLELIDRYDYILHGQITVSHEEWWRRYYEPLEKHIQEMQYVQSATRKLIDEIQSFKNTETNSIFFILQKKN